MSSPNPTDEKEVWNGTPSQVRHLGVYALCVVAALVLVVAAVKVHGSSVPSWVPLALLLVPLIVAGKRWLETACEHITLTDQRLILRRGVLARTSDFVELYRVKDSNYTQSLFERVVGLGTIVLRTTQDSERIVRLDGLRSAESLWTQLRNLVEACRKARGVREVDMNSEAGG